MGLTLIHYSSIPESFNMLSFLLLLFYYFIRFAFLSSFAKVIFQASLVYLQFFPPPKATSDNNTRQSLENH